MTEAIGFDRLIELDWLDLVASRLRATDDPAEALAATAELVRASTNAVGASRHGAVKTMTVVGRVWVKVPEHVRPLRDGALDALTSLGPTDRMAVHWAMCQLAYPFFLDASAIGGRLLTTQGNLTVGILRSRLADRWGARASLPLGARKVLGTWISWGIVREVARGRYQAEPAKPVGAVAAGIVAEARVVASGSGGMDLDDLQHSPDLFPFWLPEVRPLMRGSDRIIVQREGGHRWVARPTASSR